MRSQILHWNLKVWAYFFVRLNNGSHIFSFIRSQIYEKSMIQIFLLEFEIGILFLINYILLINSRFHTPCAVGPSLARTLAQVQWAAILFPLSSFLFFLSSPLSFFILLCCGPPQWTFTSDFEKGNGQNGNKIAARWTWVSARAIEGPRERLAAQGIWKRELINNIINWK